MKKIILRCICWGVVITLFVSCSVPKNSIVLSELNHSGGLDPNNLIGKNLTFYWIDVEGGAATLIVTPTGESVLIDSGNPGQRDADRILHVAKNIAGLNQIDHLITTHWHIDHYGGAAELAKKISILEVHDKGIPETLPEDKEFASRIQPYRDMAVKKRNVMQPNQLLNLKKLPVNLPKLSLRLVGLDKNFVSINSKSQASQNCDTPDKAPDTSDNANSMVLVLDYGGFRFFDGGDLTWNVEKTLGCPQNMVGTVDVYQVNHHGLDQSNHPALIKSLAPTVSVMNNGTRKGGGPETITTLKNTPSLQANYQLHKNIRPDSVYNTPDLFIANMQENCKANYITMSVAPDGKSYTVGIPANNQQQTFKTKETH